MDRSIKYALPVAIVLVLLFPLLVVGQDLTLTDDGKVPGKPFQRPASGGGRHQGLGSVDTVMMSRLMARHYDLKELQDRHDQGGPKSS